MQFSLRVYGRVLICNEAAERVAGFKHRADLKALINYPVCMISIRRGINMQ